MSKAFQTNKIKNRRNNTQDKASNKNETSNIIQFPYHRIRLHTDEHKKVIAMQKNIRILEEILNLID